MRSLKPGPPHVDHFRRHVLGGRTGSCRTARRRSARPRPRRTADERTATNVAASAKSPKRLLDLPRRRFQPCAGRSTRLRICPASVALLSFARASSLQTRRDTASPRMTNHAGIGSAARSMRRARAPCPPFRGPSRTQLETGSSACVANAQSTRRANGASPRLRYSASVQTAASTSIRFPLAGVASAGSRLRQSPLRRAPAVTTATGSAKSICRAASTAHRRRRHRPQPAATAAGRPHRLSTCRRPFLVRRRANLPPDLDHDPVEEARRQKPEQPRRRQPAPAPSRTPSRKGPPAA